MESVFIIFGGDLRKELIYRSFFESADTQNLQNFEETGFTFYLLPNDGDQGVNRHRDPQLSPHRVLGSAKEGFDSEVLLDPFEEQFNLPPLLIELGDAQGWQIEVIGEEDQAAQLLTIIEANAAQFVGIALPGVEGCKGNRLIAAQSGSLVDPLRAYTTKAHPALGAGDKPSLRSVDGIEPGVIDVSTIHQIEGTRFIDQAVQ